MRAIDTNVLIHAHLEHGVQTLVSEDRDMRRFKGLEVIPI